MKTILCGLTNYLRRALNILKETHLKPKKVHTSFKYAELPIT